MNKGRFHSPKLQGPAINERIKSKSVRVWDSTAEIRYLVLPLQPKDSIGLPVPELAKWVTRNSMIGTGLPLRPVGD